MQAKTSVENTKIVPTCMYCFCQGHSILECPHKTEKPQQVSKTLQNPTSSPSVCKYCANLGHTVVECKDRLRDVPTITHKTN